MEAFKFSSTFLFLLAYATFTCPSIILAQNSPQDYVTAHNSARSLVGVASVTWNTTLEAYAQTYANQRKTDCNLIHSSGPYGENLARGNNNYAGTTAVTQWVAEKNNYNYNTNSCNTGTQCLHYTQVVWHDSVQIGCYRVACSNPSGYYFIICSYNPPGNWVGEYPY